MRDWLHRTTYRDSSLFGRVRHSTTFPANPLLVACTYGFHEMLEQLLKHDSEILDTMTSDGYNCLELAASYGNLRTTQDLLRRVISLDLTSHKSQYWIPSLLEAVARTCREVGMMEFLIKTIPNCVIDDTVLVAAAQNNFCSREMVRLLFRDSENIQVNESIAEEFAAECKSKDAMCEVLSRLEKLDYVERLLKAATRNPACRTDLLNLLLEQFPDTYVSEEVILEFFENGSVRQDHDVLDVLEILFTSSRHSPVTSQMIQGAASRYASTAAVKFLLSRYMAETVSKEVMIAAVIEAVSNSQWAILKMLSENFKTLYINEDILETVIESCSPSPEMLNWVLKNARGDPLSKRLFHFALENSPRPYFFIEYLSSRKERFEMTQKALRLESGVAYIWGLEINLLLSQPRAVPLPKEMLEVLIVNGFSFLVQEFPQPVAEYRCITTVSESMVIAALYDARYCRRGLQILFNEFETIPITNNVIRYVVSLPGQLQLEILKFLLEEVEGVHVSSDVLTIGAQSHLEIMCFLMERFAPVHITEDLLKASIRGCSREHGSEVLQLLLKQPKKARVTETILVEAAMHGNICVMRLLLTHYQGEISSQIVAAAASNGEHGLMIMHLLLSGRSVHVSQEALFNVARNDRGHGSYLMMKLLITYAPDLPINEEVAIIAAGNRVCATDMLRLLLVRSSKSIITERVLSSAVQNSKLGEQVVKLLFRELGIDMAISEEIVKLAASNPFSGKQILEYLLTRRGESCIINENTLKSATSVVVPIDRGRRRTLSDAHEVALDVFGIIGVAAFLLEKLCFLVTEEVLVSAAANEASGRKLVRLLLCHPKANIRVGSQTLEAAASNTKQGDSIFEILLEIRPSEVIITESIIIAAAENHGDGKLILQRLFSLAAEQNHELEADMVLAYIRQDRHGVRDALFQAAYRGQERAVTTLLQNGASMQEEIFGIGTVALVAAFSGRLRIVQLLLSHGADMNRPGGPHKNALHAACTGRHLDVVRELVDAGANVNDKDNMGRSILHRALMARDDQLTGYIMDLGANIIEADCQGCCAIHHAARAGYDRGISKLISHGTPVNLQDDFGWTPLHYASRPSHIEIVEMLIRAGADRTRLDSNGHAPLDISVLFGRSGHSSVLSWIGMETPRPVEQAVEVDASFWCDGCSPINIVRSLRYLLGVVSYLCTDKSTGKLWLQIRL